ncbi:MAG: hypothetical protein MZU95_10330 [Desulfomicrobium escambiense]|nr:hypothetical protein [Desulfomicrobium escambiense]
MPAYLGSAHLGADGPAAVAALQAIDLGKNFVVEISYHMIEILVAEFAEILHLALDELVALAALFQKAARILDPWTTSVARKGTVSSSGLARMRPRGLPASR